MVLLGVALLIVALPMEDINDWVFKIEGIIYIIFKDTHEDVTYDKVKFSFDTNYDRENPVTRKEALAAWTKQKNTKVKV